MNGKPGDDPASDILHHGKVVFSAEIDGQVRQLATLMDLRPLQEFLSSLSGLATDEVGRAVQDKLAASLAEAKRRGWEVL